MKPSEGKNKKPLYQDGWLTLNNTSETKFPELNLPWQLNSNATSSNCLYLKAPKVKNNNNKWLQEIRDDRGTKRLIYGGECDRVCCCRSVALTTGQLFHKAVCSSPWPTPVHTHTHTHLWDRFVPNLSHKCPCKVAPACRWETQAATTSWKDRLARICVLWLPVMCHTAHSALCPPGCGISPSTDLGNGSKMKSIVPKTGFHTSGDSTVWRLGDEQPTALPSGGLRNFFFFPLVPIGEKKTRPRATAPPSALHVPASSAAHLLCVSVLKDLSMGGGGGWVRVRRWLQCPCVMSDMRKHWLVLGSDQCVCGRQHTRSHTHTHARTPLSPAAPLCLCVICLDGGSACLFWISSRDDVQMDERTKPPYRRRVGFYGDAV